MAIYFKEIEVQGTGCTITLYVKWSEESRSCTIENGTVVGRGYFSQTSIVKKESLLAR